MSGRTARAVLPSNQPIYMAVKGEGSQPKWTSTGYFTRFGWRRDGTSRALAMGAQRAATARTCLVPPDEMSK
jgi:hypothetical protein